MTRICRSANQTAALAYCKKPDSLDYGNRGPPSPSARFLNAPQGNVPYLADYLFLDALATFFQKNDPERVISPFDSFPLIIVASSVGVGSFYAKYKNKI